MKCSLLTLSTFIDESLPEDRAAEVDAHLVGCPRCSAGVATLREERDRVGSLARVRVDWGSAQALLDQVGIGATTARPEPARRERAPLPSAPTRPWLSAGGGAALPWTPQRPRATATPIPAITEESSVHSVSPDVQPDLPFDAQRDDAATIASPEVEAHGHPTRGAAVVEADPDLDDLPVPPLDDWETAIPPFMEIGDTAATPLPEPSPWPSTPTWREPVGASATWEADASPTPTPTVEADLAPPTAPDVVPQPPSSPLPMGPPERLERATGPRALFERARDLVGVRLALARPAASLDTELDALPPVAPEPLLPVRKAEPIHGFGDPHVDAALPVPHAAMPTNLPDPGASSPEMTPQPRPMTPAAARADAIRALRQQAEDAAPIAGMPEDWNAFGASAYQGQVNDGAAAERMGRHLRQARRQSVPVRVRVAPVVSAVKSLGGTLVNAAGGAARAGSGAVHRVGTRRGRPAATTRRSTPVNPRLILAGAAAVVVFLLALLVGRGTTSSPSHTAGTATRSTAPTTSQSQAAPPATQSTPSTQASSTPTSTSAPLSGVQSFGGSATGVTLERIRYGALNGAQRLVFDVAGTGGGAPATSIGFANPTTLLITFRGSSPPVSWASPPAGGVVQSVTTVSTSKGVVTVRLTLSRAVNPVAFYLSGPERFVLDLH